MCNKIVNLLNDLLEKDRPAIAALIVNRVPCNQLIADHNSVQVSVQQGGFHLSILGLLNGLCNGQLCAEFINDPNNLTGFAYLNKFFLNGQSQSEFSASKEWQKKLFVGAPVDVEYSPSVIRRGVYGGLSVDKTEYVGYMPSGSVGTVVGIPSIDEAEKNTWLVPWVKEPPNFRKVNHLVRSVSGQVVHAVNLDSLIRWEEVAAVMLLEDLEYA